MENRNKLAFTRKNYVLMLAGIALLCLGFFLMTLEDAPHGFGPLALTVGPLVVMAGFLLEIFAILHKSSR
jgi:uncharacterized membrane protein YiaA